MKAETSAYLDLVRFCAALVVACDHLADYTGFLFWQVGAFGAPAVDVFFVLSGHVIAYAAANRESSITRYAVSRAARLYSVVVPALVISFVLGAVGKALRPAVNWGDTSLASYLRCLTFTNELWFANVTPGYDGPFWSLGYEVWYYLAFAAAFFGRGFWRYALTMLCVAAAGPRILMMFPLWLMGVAAWRLSARIGLTPFRAALLWCADVAVAGALVLWHLHRITSAHPPPDVVPAAARALTGWRPYVADYGIGLLVALNFLAFDVSAQYWARLTHTVEKPVRWLAGATFTLYLLHVPLGQFLAATSPWRAGTTPQRIFVMGGTFGTVFLVAHYTERRKAAWRNIIGRMIGRGSLPVA